MTPDPYSQSHLSEASIRIEKALDADYIYNASSMGGGGVLRFMREPQIDLRLHTLLRSTDLSEARPFFGRGRVFVDAQKNSGDFNQRLDHPCLWTREGIKPGRCLLKGSSMGDPGVGLNGAIGN